MQKAKKFLQSSRSKWISLALFIIVLSSNPGMLIAPEPPTNDIDSPMQPSYTGTPGLYRASYDFSNGLVGWESWGTSYPIKQITNYDMLGHHKTICFNDIGQSAWDSYGIKQTFDKGYDVGFVEFYCMASPNGSPQLNLVSDTGSYYLSFTPYYIQVNYGTNYNVPLNLEGQWNNLKLKWNYNTDQLTIYNNGVYISTLPLTSGSKMTGFWAFSWGNYYSKYWIIDDIGFSWDYNYKEGDNSQLKDTSGIYGGQYSRTCLNFYDDIVGQSPTSVSLIPTDTSQSIIVQDNGQKYLKLAHSVSESGSNVNSYGFIVTPSISLTKGRLDFYFTGTQYSKPCLNFVSNLGSYYVDLCDTSIDAYYGGSYYASLPINYNFKSTWNHIWFEWDCQSKLMAIFVGETESGGNYKGCFQLPNGVDSINAFWFFQWSSQYVNPSNSPTSWSIDTITIHGIRDYNKQLTFDFDPLNSNTPYGLIPFGSNTNNKNIKVAATSTGQHIVSIVQNEVDSNSNSYGFRTEFNCDSTIGSVDFWLKSSANNRPEIAFTNSLAAFYIALYDTYIQTSLGNTLPHNLQFKQKWIHLWMDWDCSQNSIKLWAGDLSKTSYLGELSQNIPNFNQMWFFSWANNPTEWSIDNINLTINSPGNDLSQRFVFDYDGDGLSNNYEINIGSNPFKADTDDDGLSDYHEKIIYNTLFFSVDSDQDGLTDGQEVLQYGTNPTNSDTDNDRLTDQYEITHSYNPLNSDMDGDGMNDGWEVQYNLNPQIYNNPNLHSDLDGLTDGHEASLGCNPYSIDSDGDGYSDWFEVYDVDTNPCLADTDGDGRSDWDETFVVFGSYNILSDPLDLDSDDDGMSDGWEVDLALNPNQADAQEDEDEDGLTNLQEFYFQTDPREYDTDGDGIGDYEEYYGPYTPIEMPDNFGEKEDLYSVIRSLFLALKIVFTWAPSEGEIIIQKVVDKLLSLGSLDLLLDAIFWSQGDITDSSLISAFWSFVWTLPITLYDSLTELDPPTQAHYWGMVIVGCGGLIMKKALGGWVVTAVDLTLTIFDVSIFFFETNRDMNDLDDAPGETR